MTSSVGVTTDDLPREAKMTDSRTIFDPFLGGIVEISDRLADRLRGKYAVGPTLPNGEPEFGWRQHEVPPIQKEAADEIERLRKALDHLLNDKTVSYAVRAGRARRILAAVGGAK